MSNMQQGSGSATVASRTLTLSDGRIAECRRPNGYDLELGAAMAGQAASPIALMMGVVAQVATVDGKMIVYEDLRGFPMEDVLALIGAVAGNGPAPSQG